MSSTSPTPNNVAGEATTLEEWKIEREKLSNQIKGLEQQVEQLTSESNSTKPPVEGVLRNFYALGLKMSEAGSSKDLSPSAPIITKSLVNMSTESLGSSYDLLDHIDSVTSDSEPVSETINSLVKSVFTLYNSPTDRTFLNGNFGPVKEQTHPTTNLILEEGYIPKSLNGMMLRNGPNPHFKPEGNYMWLDGESMIHGVRFKQGNAISYAARYTKTARYIQQDKLKKAEIIKYGDLVGPYGLFATLVQELRRKLEILDARSGITTANDGLIYHGGRIMALEDFGLPYVIHVTENGDLETHGMNNYNGKLDHWLSPHPRIDPVTGEMFTLGSLRTDPYCIYRVISKEGVMGDPIPIRVPKPTYMHELCITKNYVIFQDLSLVYDPEKMETTEKEWIFNYDDTKMSRYGILPRDAKSDETIVWFDFDEPSFVFHNANAWEEEDGTIVLYCCNMEAKIDKHTQNRYIAPYMFQRFNVDLKDFVPTTPQLYKLTFKMPTKENPIKEKPKKELIEKPNLPENEKIYGDFPKINPKYFGRKTRFVYIGQLNNDNKIISVVKYDLSKTYGDPKPFRFDNADPPTRFGSEVAFVPKTDNSKASEDDGYLITFVHHEYVHDLFNASGNIGISYVYVIDAKTMKSVAKIRLPSRVPYGFHSIYITEEELKNQKRINWFK